MSKLKSKPTSGFPTVITNLPEADLPFTGVRAWILQGEDQQLIFFDFQPDAQVPEHSHSYPQWGMVIEGKMRLTINGRTKTMQKGDEYVIPNQAKHRAEFQTEARVMDFFSEKARYKPKPQKSLPKTRPL